MGGNALTCTSVRLTKANYSCLVGECLAKLRTRYPGVRVEPLRSYQDKADFGDCDFLVERGEHYDPVRAAAALDAVEIVRTPLMMSVGVIVRPEVPYRDGNVFQVDLIPVEAEAFDYAAGFYAYNDLGSILVRLTARRMGLSHREDGLWLRVHDGGQESHELCLTRDHPAALRFLGFDPVRFAQGFAAPADIYQYVADSMFFNADVFKLENRSAKDRKSDARRPVYMGFLKWCEARPELPAYSYPEDKTAWLPRVAEHFPHFQAEYDQALADLAELRAVKAKFNGDWVAQLTGLQGKELGELMKRFKESFETPAAQRAFVMASSDEGLEARVREVWATLAEEPR